jgi:RimJ/RimL family protein N-acetyltransferase
VHLETDRLVIRPWRVDEAPRLFEVLSDPETVRWFGTPVPLTDVAQAVERIEGYARYDLPHGVWTMSLGPAGRPLGGVMLIGLDGTDPTQVGWYLHPDSTGHGYATEACAAVLAFGLAQGLDEVRAVIDVANTPSLAVARRLGMRHLGRVDEDTRPAEVFTSGAPR